MRRNPTFEKTCWRHRFFGDASRISKASFSVRCQCKGTNRNVHHGYPIFKMVVLCQQRDRQATIYNQNPDQGTHDGSNFIGVVHPNAVFVCCPKGTIPAFIIEVIFVVHPLCIRRRTGTTYITYIGYNITCSSSKGSPISFVTRFVDRLRVGVAMLLRQVLEREMQVSKSKPRGMTFISSKLNILISLPVELFVFSALRRYLDVFR